ncbi:LytR/AlgR family response regulator transcription factor [Caldinitratiruptor microaerophilus]|uniref:Stage 0 sporulation protein A homolog n=1 Tax=Caldinitratiruptor microaerophilus TaxID=671077 RepID=A0AA35CHJ3_9FIRM|nr:LytTR family DNA-binding domain-containing protein [Caldinitratiruptor microaerophilus]BDG59099.1 DNA-binding response regulator [Caldinitratiruptor microaerophilus]
MALRALIVDDEAPARLQLRLRLERFPEVEVVGEAQSGREALELLRALDYDVVFIDIRMPGLSGLEVAEALKNRQPAPRVVFVTAYEEYALRAFGARAFDYLLKPFDDERLAETIRRLQEAQRERQGPGGGDAAGGSGRPRGEGEGGRTGEGAPGAGPRELQWLLVQRDGVSVPLAVQDVIFVESQGDYVAVVTHAGRFLARYSIQELAQWLPASRFVRCHRSYIVNVACVREIAPMFNGTYLLRMKDRERSEVPVSRSGARRLRGLFWVDARGGG